MKVLYKPLGVLVGVTGGLLAGAAFKEVWLRLAGEERAPHPTDHERGWSEVVVAAALHGAIVGAVKAAVDRAGAVGYQQATGVWPGKDG